jgi:hypothetical protein
MLTPPPLIFLLRTQRNTLHQLISRSGLPTADFTLTDDPETGALLTHHPTGFFIDFQHSNRSPDSFTVHYSPNYTYPAEPTRYKKETFSSWYWVIDLVNNWLKWVHWEHNSPDLWAPTPPKSLPVPRTPRKAKAPLSSL